MTSLQNSKTREVNEARLQEVLGQYAPIALCLLDHEFRIRHCNDLFLEILDAKYDHCAGRPIADHIAELTPQFLNEILKSVKKKGQKKGTSSSRLFFQRQECVLNIRIVTELIPESCFYLLAIQTVQTPSETIAAQSSIQKRNLALGQRALDSMPTLNYIFDIEEKKTSYRSGRGYELLGYPSEDVSSAPGEFLEGLMDPADLAQWASTAARWKDVKDGDVLKAEFRLRDAQGRWRWFLSADTVYSRTAGGSVKEVIGTAQEITDRKNMEEERRKSDERFRRYFELGLIGIAVTSLQKCWVEVNDYICQMLDYSRDELKKKTWVELTDPDDLESDLACFKQLLAGEIESYTLDKRFIKKDGATVYTSIAVSCVRDNSGQPDHVVVLIQDISGRKGTEKELSQYRDHLEELVKARTAELYAANEKLRQEICERRQVEETLQKKNIALNEILGQIEIEKKVVRDQVMANVERLLLPTIKKLSVEDRELRQDYIALLVRNLKEMTSSFGSNITSKYYKLTPREIEICNMIKSRLSNKEISKLLNISLRTVETHRNDIRKKLSLSHKNVNLATYLQAM